MSSIELTAVSSVAEIAADEWNACASGDSATTTGAPGNPFLEHAFFDALERSRSAIARTGWTPRHLLAHIDGQLVGAAPCYLKSHSRGEYVFDRGWAEGYEQAGGRYYPKLQVAVPFTPATGSRLLVRADAERDTVRNALAQGLVALCRMQNASGVHVTFAREDEASFLGERGFLLRTDRQFHWNNEGYGTFDDFLGAMNSRHRKQVKRERRDALAESVSVHWLTGNDINEEALDAFFDFYIETGSRKWGSPYLTREFYSLVAETMRDRILLVMAKRNGRWIAGAINFIGDDTLYGRHWGAIEHHPFLHFEVCYYQAVAFAIDRKLKHVEAGAQGEHKVARGYMPCTTHSAHYIDDPALRRAIADYLKRERAYVEMSVEELAEAAPFRRDGTDTAS